MRVSYDTICRVLGVRPAGSFPGLEATGAAIDSRCITPGQMFVCIPGARVDGHDFAGAALAAGASLVLAERIPDTLPEGAPLVLVPDTASALGRLAAFLRTTCGARVVGVTGTAGKTTVKEVLAQMLALRGRTAKNPMNFNNRIGLPLSILNTEGTEEFWVLEVGISKPHDMDELGAVLRPDLALVLNVGAGHTEGLGTRKVPYYKARLLHWLSEDGVGLISADYPDLVRECRALGRKMFFFSADGKQASYKATCNSDPDGTGAHGLYRLQLEDGVPFDVATPFRWSYGAENTVAVAAAAHLLGLTQEEITRGFAQACLPAQRFSHRACGPWLIIDDSYNANPLSCRRMLDAARETAQSSPLVCVMGEMGELGETAGEEHEQLGRCMAAAMPRVIFWKGKYAEEVRDGLRREGYAGDFITPTDSEDFSCRLEELRISGGVVLFKGSRSNRLEDFVKAFEAWEASRAL